MRFLYLILVVFLVGGCAGGTSPESFSDGLAAVMDALLDTSEHEGSDLQAADEGTDFNAADAGEEGQDSLIASADAGAIDAAELPEQSSSDTKTKDAQIATAGLNGTSPPYDEPIEQITGVADNTGAPVGVEDLKGSWMVLWFFPKAATIG